MDIVTTNKRFGFTLVELLTVIIIIAIISAVAIPSYKNNVIRTQIGTMFHDAEAAKLAVSSDFYRSNSFTSTYNNGTTDFTTKNSDCVSSIAVANGVITVQGDSTKFSGKNIWIRWTPSLVNNDLSWQCTASPDAAPFVNSDYCQ